MIPCSTTPRARDARTVRLSMVVRLLVSLFCAVPTLFAADWAASQVCGTFPYPVGRSTAFLRPPLMDRAKDFAVVRKDGIYHVFYIRVDRNTGDEIDFGHATSPDLLTWTPQPTVNPDGGYTDGAPDHPTWDEEAVWAPSIIEMEGTYYMFFTGVDAAGQQRIGVSTSPDLFRWIPHAGNPVFQCPGGCADFRDPFVIRDEVARDGSGIPGWLMYYTGGLNGSSENVSVAWASYSNPFSWTLIGAIEATVGNQAESPHIFKHGGLWYLFSSVPTLRYITGTDPVALSASSWSAPVPYSEFAPPGGDPVNWFASEFISNGTNDYFLFIHDYDGAGPCDPLCGNNPTASAIEAKVIPWNPDGTFDLADLSATSDGSQWTEQCASAAPPARWNASIIHDQANDRLIMFGGRSTDTHGGQEVHYGDTWAYSLSSHVWSPLATSGTAPAARAFHGAIYDAARQRMVLTGGGGPSVGDNRQVHVLSLSGTPTWSAPSSSGGPPNGFDHMSAVHDSDRDQMVTTEVSNGVWKLNLATLAWSPIAGTLPSQSKDGTTVYDKGHQRLLLVGGWAVAPAGGHCISTLTTSQNVHSLDLTQPSPSWSLLSTAPWAGRYEPTAYYDGLRNRLTVFGGLGHSQECKCAASLECGPAKVVRELTYADVWTMDLNSLTWAQRNPRAGTPPPGRGRHVGAFDVTRDQLTVFGGGDYMADASQLNCYSVCAIRHLHTYRNDTWAFQPPDDIPPATAGLAGGGGCYNKIFLGWTAPGDDGTTGTAVAYDLRWSITPMTPANFANAQGIAIPAPQPAGSPEEVTVSVPQCSGFRYYALKTRDEANNWSAMSNVVKTKPFCPQPPMSCDDFRARPSVEEAALPRMADLSVTNPAEGLRTSLRFAVPAERAGEPYDVSVFDLAGRRIVTLDQGVAAPGYHDLEWDLDSEGRSVGRGVYMVRYRLGDLTMTRRIIAIR